MVRKETISLLATALLVASIVGVTGAQSLGSLGTSTDTTHPSIHAYPEKPSPLTASNVGRFAATYEEAYIYESLTDSGGRVIDMVTFSCDPNVAEIQSADDFLVLLECRYTHEAERDEESLKSGATRSYTVSYVINADETVRNEPNRASDTGGSSGSQTVSTVHYLDLPEKPPALDDSTVVSYATAYEKATKHNNVVASHSDGTLTDVDVYCRNPTVERTNNAFVATLECGYGYTTQNGGGVAVADGVPYTVAYTIDTDDVERVVHRTASDSRSNGPTN